MVATAFSLEIVRRYTVFSSDKNDGTKIRSEGDATLAREPKACRWLSKSLPEAARSEVTIKVIEALGYE
jgi:hypothetical protein